MGDNSVFVKIKNGPWGYENVKNIFFDFGFESLIIFSYCTIVCRHNVVDFNCL